MTPTSYAFEIAAPLRAALQSMSSTLARAAQPFVPGEVKRSFVIAASDYVSAILLPVLLQRMAVEAPGIDLVITPSTRLDLAEQLDLGLIDIGIGMFRDLPDRLRSRHLLLQDEVIICRRGHPITNNKLLLQDLAEYPMLVVSLAGEENGARNGYILERGLARKSEMYDREALEQALGQAGLSTRRQVTIPHFLTFPMLLADTNMLGIVPRPLAETFCRTLPLVLKELPYPVNPRQLEMLWHSNKDADPAQRWLQSMIVAVAQSITAA
jgi:DNA-binding transcriptional LysR family regulator